MTAAAYCLQHREGNPHRPGRRGRKSGKPVTGKNTLEKKRLT